MTLSSVVDSTLEFPIIPSFSRIGHDVRRRTDGWADLAGYDLTGRVVLITGATSGLGRSAARRIAEAGADVLLVGRTAERNDAVAHDLRSASGNDSIVPFAADMGELADVRALAEFAHERYERLDVLIHNAGALLNDRTETTDGTEATIASQVVGPFLLTSLLLDRLATTPGSRVLTMSSGGMYTAPLTISSLELDPDHYQGARQYALAKRAQVTLNELWAERFAESGIRFHALHPGWADTPGVDASLPTFSKVMGPLLRSPDQGADTLVWLAADDGAPLETNGLFWLDRRPRAIHRLRSTRRSDTADRRVRLWDWVCERSGSVPQVDVETTTA